MTVRYAAPGRINLIGEHTDYNLGFALPIALPQRTVVTFTPGASDAITVGSDRVESPERIPLDTVPGDVAGWGGYVAGVIWALGQAGYPVPGGTMSISSDVEMGSGLSSSAALECAALGAIASAAGVRIDAKEQALIAQRAENEYVGAPTGLLDQLASLFARAIDGSADRLSRPHCHAGALRSGLERRRAAADRLPRAAPSCRRRLCGSTCVVRAGRC